jgi:hypothetical protein
MPGCLKFLLYVGLFLNARPCIVTNSLSIKPTGTKFQFYWYYDSTCFGQSFCPSSGALSRTSSLVQFYAVWWPFAARIRTELHEFRPDPGSKWSSNGIKLYERRCTTKSSWWWAERLPETCRVVIPIKLDFNVFFVLFTRKWVCLFVCLFLAQQPPVDQGLLIHEVSRSHTTTHHSR